MKNYSSKLLFIFSILIFYSCSEIRKIQKEEYLLHKNDIVVNGKKDTKEELYIQLYQKPNVSLLGFKTRLQLYNLAHPNREKAYQEWLKKHPKTNKTLEKILSRKQVDRLGQSFLISGFDNLLKKLGEPPSLYDSIRTKKSKKRLKAYFTNRGYYDVDISCATDTLKNRKIISKYFLKTGNAYTIDSIYRSIESKAADSLYAKSELNRTYNSGDVISAKLIEDEKSRITEYFKNNGLFYFDKNFISFKYDTINKKNKGNLILQIDNRVIKKNDSLFKAPFEINRISQVNIFTEKQTDEKGIQKLDTLTYNNYKLYSSGKLKYFPRILTDALFLHKGDIYSDFSRVKSINAINNLKVFNYPNISFIDDPNKKDNLIANVFLVPKKRFNFNLNLDLTHSNIQDYGISSIIGFTYRNIFKRAETLNFSLRGNLGASREIANPNDLFFNIIEYGADVKLNIPRIFFPIPLKSLITRDMSPNTVFTLGTYKQTNVGLDKESFSGGLFYEWQPKKSTNWRFDLFNLQFIRNLNVGNYFNVYRTSYTTLNTIKDNYIIPNVEKYVEGGNLTLQGATLFIEDVKSGALFVSENDFRSISSIGERRQRLIEDNLILASTVAYNYTSKIDLNDNNFYSFRGKIESSGNVTSLLSKWKNESNNPNENKTLFGIDYSQYVKGELEYTRHIPVSSRNLFAFRLFGGIAIPYGNSNSIPFIKSYFAGGNNDNRGWQAYSLGPGRSRSSNDFNEANLKLAANAEYRFRIAGKFNGALFVDAGNIWNVFDEVTQDEFIFKGFKSLTDIALGSGFGLRYNIGYFVVRIDLGFKTYNPAEPISRRWFKSFTLNDSVFQFGVNYPF